MTRQDVSAYIMSTEGLVDATEVEESVKKLAATVSDLICVNEGVDPDDEWARAGLAIMHKDGKVVSMPKPTETKDVQLSTAPATVSAEAMYAIKNQLEQNRAANMQASATNAIEKVVIQKPGMKEYVPSGATFTVDKAKVDDFLKKYPRNEVLESTLDAYDEIVAALQQGHPLKVNYTGMPKRVLGVLLGMQGSSDISYKVMDTNEMFQYLVLNTGGTIPGSADRAGAKLAVRKTKKTVQGTQVKGGEEKPVIKYTTVTNALENGNYVLLQKPTTDPNAALAKISVKSELFFKVAAKTKDGKPRRKQNNEQVYRTVRVSGTLDTKALVWDPEYEDKFNSNKSGASNNTVLPSQLEQKKLDDIRAQAIADVVARVNTGEVAALAISPDFKMYLDSVKGAEPRTQMVV